MPRDLHLTAAGRLRGVGQRYTPNRRTIVQALAAASRPLPVSEILARRRGLPQSSVYRNLLVLEQAGVVRRIQSSDEFSRFELAEDLIGHHHHLVCSSCGSIEDFDAPSHLERAVARTVDLIAESSRFGVEAHHLQLTGLCSACS